MNKHIIFEHDYLNEIKDRLYAKADLLNISTIIKATGVPRRTILAFCKGQIPVTSFQNIVKLYKYIEQNNI